MLVSKQSLHYISTVWTKNKGSSSMLDLPRSSRLVMKNMVKRTTTFPWIVS